MTALEQHLVSAHPTRVIEKIRDTYRIELRRFMKDLLGDAGDSSD